MSAEAFDRNRLKEEAEGIKLILRTAGQTAQEETRNVVALKQLLMGLMGEMVGSSEAAVRQIGEAMSYVVQTPADDITDRFGFDAEQLRNLKENYEQVAESYERVKLRIRSVTANGKGEDKVSETKIATNRKLARSEEEVADAQQQTNRVTSESIEVTDSSNRQLKLLKGSTRQAAQAVASYGKEMGDAFQQIGRATGSAGLESFGKTFSDVAEVAGKAASGDYIGAALSAVTKGVTAIFSAKAKERAALAQMARERKEFLHDYALSLADEKLEGEKLTNAFGSDTLQKAADALEVAQEYHDKYEGSIAKKKRKIFRPFASNPIEEVEYSQLENIRIVTRHRTWFRSERSKTLKELYPELFEGGFNVEAARVLLQTNNQLNDEAKKQIQNVVDLYDKWKEAEEQFKEYLTDTFGDLGNDLGDCIVKAFADGTDAMQEWKASFVKVLEGLGKQLMQTLYFQESFDKLQEDLTEVYRKGDDMKLLGSDVQALLGGFFGQMEGQVRLAGEFWKEWDKLAGSYGFDLSPEKVQEGGLSKGIEAVSQESVNELNGCVTAIQGHTWSISEDMKQLVLQSGEQLRLLGGIESNTAYCRKLETMEADMGQMRLSLETIRDKGVMLRR